MINKCFLGGYLGGDPKQDMASHPVTFSLATNKTWRDKDSGERKQKVSWHNIVVWNEQLQKIAMQYLKKGSKVILEGEIHTREYESNGQRRWTTELVLDRFGGGLTMLDSSGSGGRAPAPTREDHGVRDYQRPLDSGPGQYYQGDPNAKPRTTMDADFNDEIPF